MSLGQNLDARGDGEFMDKKVSVRGGRSSPVAQQRRGLAVVELAVCLPIIVILVLGAIEACTMVFLKQSLHIAAYEGARVAIDNRATNQKVLDRCEQLLNERKINGATVDLGGLDIESLPRGSEITVQVEAPVNLNCRLLTGLVQGSVQAAAVMIKE